MQDICKFFKIFSNHWYGTLQYHFHSIPLSKIVHLLALFMFPHEKFSLLITSLKFSICITVLNSSYLAFWDILCFLIFASPNNYFDPLVSDCVQLGFLPKDTAKWVAPLCDIGFFCFSAFIYPKEALAAALEGTNSRVQLILYVSQACHYYIAICYSESPFNA